MEVGQSPVKTVASSSGGDTGFSMVRYRNATMGCLLAFIQKRQSQDVWGIFQIFDFNKIEFWGSSTFASVRPHKKAVKKIEAEGAKEKQLLLKLGNAISP
jgi:hypothetical protein